MLLITKVARRDAEKTINARAELRTLQSLEHGESGALLANTFDFATLEVRVRLHLVLCAAALLIIISLAAHTTHISETRSFYLVGKWICLGFYTLVTIVPIRDGAWSNAFDQPSQLRGG